MIIEINMFVNDDDDSCLLITTMIAIKVVVVGKILANDYRNKYVYYFSQIHVF